MEAADSTRSFLRDVKRIVIKVGTAVVTQADGRLALGRVGSLCEQIHELITDGYEVILVTSGAVGVGRQRLRYRRLVNSSFADLQKPQVELDGKACAAVGQNGLMALYDTLFSQLDTSSAQLLVTDNDFRDPDFRRQLNETVKSLLSLKVVPIFNENDAISTRKAPYEDASGIFWDNDSLAALLALELKADLLVLLSDVDGLYSGPPSDPHSELIHTYVKESHEGLITFGDKSRVGRGGMTAKVKAAVYAAYAGIPVVITSGFAYGNILKVLGGQRIGTLFHRDAHKWATVGELGVREMAVAARDGSRRLQAMSSHERSKILLSVADALEASEKLITAENEADVAEALKAGYDKALVSRLALKPGKVSSLANSIRVLANMEEPVGRVLKRMEMIGLQLFHRPRMNLVIAILVSYIYMCVSGVKIFGGPRASSSLDIPEAHSLHHEYSSLACTIEIVDDVNAAIDHIHQHGSAHTDCIVTDDDEVAEIFLRQVDSAAVFHNASTRFSDGFRFGLGAEVGISTSRIHARGPVGVEGLLTTRWLARGKGQVVNGDKDIVYTHKEMSLQA
ncbi:delta-1-pyrroline-5-carboxylate synthase-like [Salvia hispanica]|uniref:delta-1-pyrroline-5-carboxylate synthase-like n=1 Tax=Salvia hispanica TaxID=49212 RepID=UPI0020093F28|nr:delta-1-pyrroline-5-carboxylate synthase-like [Salvia hispanica]